VDTASDMLEKEFILFSGQLLVKTYWEKKEVRTFHVAFRCPKLV
jgi:hypothetical protein